MKYFQVPVTVVVKPPPELLKVKPDIMPDPFPFAHWADFMWLDDARAYVSGTEPSVVKLRRWAKVIEAFEVAKPGDWISLEDQDYATLTKIVESPQKIFQHNHTRIAIACLPYVDAVLGAKNELPEGAQAAERKNGSAAASV